MFDFRHSCWRYWQTFRESFSGNYLLVDGQSAWYLDVIKQTLGLMPGPIWTDSFSQKLVSDLGYPSHWGWVCQVQVQAMLENFNHGFLSNHVLTILTNCWDHFKFYCMILHNHCDTHFQKQLFYVNLWLSWCSC